MCNQSIPYIVSVSLVVDPTVEIYSLKNVSQELAKREILGLFVRSQGGNTVDRDGNTLIPDSALKGAFLHLEQGSQVVYDDYPVEHALHSSANTEPYTAMPMLNGIDLSRSYVKLKNKALATAGQVIELNFITQATCRVS